MRVISGEAAAAIFAAIEKERAEDMAAWPDTLSALSSVSRALHHLRRFGWREGIYCPKDGSSFAVIQPGSTGIFLGFYLGAWPGGNIIADDFALSADACWWKPLADLGDEERARLEQCDQALKTYLDRLGRAFGEVQP